MKSSIKNKSFSAQGTIEYLVILAVVIVISLIVVGLFVTLMDSPSQEITDSSSQIGSVAVGGISIVESVIDYEGDSLIRLTNNSSDAITLTKINVGGVDNNFSEQVVGLDSKFFSLSSLNSNCPCVSGQKSVKCEVKILYTAATGITQTEYKTINAQCVTNAIAVEDNKIINPLDNVAPVVSLFSPANDVNVFSKTVLFVFDVIETNSISSCTLRVGEDLNSYTGITAGMNTIIYTFANDKLVDWNIFCVDSSNNISEINDTWSLDVDSNNYQITTCLELQEINNNLSGNYELMNNIDCSDTINWNSGAGFDPIGDWWLNSFTGSIDGKGKSINNLYISVADGPYLGLVSVLSGAEIKNITLENVSVSGQYNIGAFAGETQSSSIIRGCSTSGTINGTGGGVGGLTGSLILSSQIINSTNYSSVTGGSSAIGGLVGTASRLSILDSNNYGSVSGGGSTGGLVGGISILSALENSHNFGSISCAENCGGIIGSVMNSSTVCDIENVSNSGDIISTGASVGGIIGSSSGITLTNSHNFGDVNSSNYSIGGILGFADNPKISFSSNSGTIVAGGTAGGIVGYGQNAGYIYLSYNEGNISGDTSIGGILGVGGANIYESYNSGTVSGVDPIGGIAGLSNNSALIYNVYNSGDVTATGSEAGGLVGRSFSVIKNAFNVGVVPNLSPYYSGGLVGNNLTGTTQNVWWFSSLSVCCGVGSCASCTKTSGVSDFYNSSHAVYNGSPTWTFGSDKNWVATATYPILSWQE